MTKKEQGTLCAILGKAVGAIGAAASVALISWGTFLKSEDDEAKKEERRNATPKE
jgi:hypothetical protein